MDDHNFSYKIEKQKGKKEKHQLQVLCSITNVTSHIFMNFCYVTSMYYKLEKSQKSSKINDGLY
jgi:uncharacterized protein (UPF0276 family)